MAMGFCMDVFLVILQPQALLHYLPVKDCEQLPLNNFSLF